MWLRIIMLAQLCGWLILALLTFLIEFILIIFLRILVFFLVTLLLNGRLWYLLAHGLRLLRGVIYYELGLTLSTFLINCTRNIGFLRYSRLFSLLVLLVHLKCSWLLSCRLSDRLVHRLLLRSPCNSSILFLCRNWIMLLLPWLRFRRWVGLFFRYSVLLLWLGPRVAWSIFKLARFMPLRWLPHTIVLIKIV